MKILVFVLFFQAAVSFGLVLWTGLPFARPIERKMVLEQSAFIFNQTAIELLQLNGDKQLIQQFESELKRAKETYWRYLDDMEHRTEMVENVCLALGTASCIEALFLLGMIKKRVYGPLRSSAP